MLRQAVCQRNYAIHGFGLSISATAGVMSVLDARLRPWRVASDCADLSDTLHFDFSVDEPIERPTGDLRPVYETSDGEVVYGADEDVLFIALGNGVRGRCDARAGTTRVWAEAPQRELWRLSHPFLTLPLTEQLKRRGLYSLHAGAVARGGRSLIFVGTSGAGKTTLTLAMARAGYDFLGDDTLFIREDSSPVLAFPDEVDVTESTARFFPELHALVNEPRQKGFPKWTLRAESLFGSSVAWSTEPAALVFPRISSEAASTIEPMSPRDALMELLPNVLLTDPPSCQGHLHALARLSQATSCYRLSTGRDFDVLPDLLERLLR